MASITSLSNSSYNMSSIYGNRNVLSGLASGMDTESMIENAVAGIKMKIQNLTKKRTKVEWQQEAYRSIIDKAVNFNTKYTSYSSKTNLLSSSFFTNAVNTVTRGTYADKVTASGKTSSDIKLNAVKQLATAATYTVSGLGNLSGGEMGAITGGKFDIAGTIPVNTMSGSLTFQYGGTNGTYFTVNFDDLENLNEVEVLNSNGTVKTNATNAEKLAQAIQNKLGEVTYNYTKNGFAESTTADKAIKVSVDANGNISFADGLGNGNKVTISGASGNIKNAFDLNGRDNQVLTGANRTLTRNTETYNYLSNKELGVTFNGTTKTISMADVIKRMGDKKNNDTFQAALQEELDDAFGAGKVNVSAADKKLAFTTKGKGDTLSLGGSAIEALGFKGGDSNFINASKKIADVLGDKAESIFSDANRLKGAGGATKRTSPNGNIYYLDAVGNRVDEKGFRVDENNKALYDCEINGAHISVTEDTTLESLLNSINSNAEAGMKVSYSKLTNEFKFTATETGANSKVEFGGLAQALFGTSHAQTIGEQKFADAFGMDFGENTSGKVTLRVPGKLSMSIEINADDTVQDVLDKFNNPESAFALGGNSISLDEHTGELKVTGKDGAARDFTFSAGSASSGGPELKIPTNPYASYTAGQDAIVDVEINGKRFEDLARSSNSFDIDGLTINAKGTFTTGVDEKGNAEDPVTFESTTDADKIVDAIRSFVDDYNEMATEIKNAYTTQPATKNGKSNGTRYEPLTAEEEEGYSESELKAYNEKAKQGILFADSTLSSMYSRLLGAITPGGTDGQALREIGITTAYNSGMTTLSLDEDKLRNALESDPDKVRNAFTKTKEGGSTSDGLMQTLQNTLNTYVKTTGEPKGVLITRAGSVKAPTSLNSNSLKNQIDNIDNQIDRWTDKMADQIDRYTTQFSRLEQLIAEMNSQASAMSGLMGGSSGY